MKKLALALLLIGVLGTTAALAVAGLKSPADIGRDAAQSYLDHSLVDENW